MWPCQYDRQTEENRAILNGLQISSPAEKLFLRVGKYWLLMLRVSHFTALLIWIRNGWFLNCLRQHIFNKYVHSDGNVADILNETNTHLKYSDMKVIQVRQIPNINNIGVQWGCVSLWLLHFHHVLSTRQDGCKCVWMECDVSQAPTHVSTQWSGSFSAASRPGVQTQWHLSRGSAAVIDF